MSGNEVFKDRQPAFLDSGVIFFFGPQGPGDTLNAVELPADPGAQIFPVGIFVGGKIRHGPEMAQTVGQDEF